MSNPRVIVAGGGIAGLEAMLALADLAGERAELTMVAPQPDFVYRPWLVEEPFTNTPAEHRELAPIAAELGAEFVQKGVTGVSPDEQLIKLDNGTSLAYDFAVICVGAQPRPAFEQGISFRSSAESAQVVDLLAGLGDGDPAEARRIAFVVPPGNAWPLPIYELALMSRRWIREKGLRGVECMIVTSEEAPLAVFGTAASDALRGMLEARGIEIRAGTLVHERDGVLTLVPGDERLDADHVVALPNLRGPAIEGLPHDGDGFIPIDEHARVKGIDAVYAAGDGTTFPIKQGGLGTQQADAAAHHIASLLGAPGEPAPFHPILRGLLMTGEESLSMEHTLAGGGGEGEASSDYLWWPPHKVSGRYLAPWLQGTSPHIDPVPPARPMEVEVALPKEWHEIPM